MKYLVYSLVFLFSAGLYAQDKDPVDKMEETKVKTVKVEKDGKMVEKKVKVTTAKEQKVKSEIEPDHYENSTRIDTPVKVTQTVAMDNDDDPFYDSESTIQYYQLGNNKYTFTQNEGGFIVTSMVDDEKMVYGNARLTSQNRYYILNTDTYSGLGYFNSQGDFVVEYYDDNLDAMVIKTFSSSEF